MNVIAIQISFNFNLERMLSCRYVGAIEAKNVQCTTMHCGRHLRSLCCLIEHHTLFYHCMPEMLIIIRTELCDTIS